MSDFIVQEFMPTDEQFRAIEAVRDWYKNGRKQWFYLAGPAGSGKSSLIRFIADACNIDPDSHRIAYGTYTGKASMVLRKKGVAGKTIHRLMYIHVTDDETGQPIFRLNEDSILNEVDLVVLDECSMIDENMSRDLMSFGKKILVLGDPEQLKPINGEGYFTRNEPDFFIHEIHRQAAENPIIYYATKVRQGGVLPFGDFGEFKKVKEKDFDYDELLQADQIITGTNKTRKELNKAMKSFLGFNERYPVQSGIKLICLRNQYSRSLYNGMTVITTTNTDRLELDGKHFIQNVREEVDEHINIDDLKMYTGHFDSYYTHYDMKNDIHLLRRGELSEFDYGYAITCHKMQGSSAEHVLLWDDHFARTKGFWDSDTRKKWLYTSITRAEEKFTLVVT